MPHPAKSSRKPRAARWGRTLAAAVALAVAAALPAETAPVTAVPQLDLDRYMGEWYEIARLPNGREEACARDVVHRYQRRSETAVGVTSTCRRSDGEEERVDVIARVRDPASHSRLEIRHAPSALGWLPFVWEDYWVLDIAPDYDTALVGDPDHVSLWILSRKPSMDRARYVALVSKAAAFGFDTQKLIQVPQNVPSASPATTTPAPR